jgi:hypothetical protein
MGVPRRGLEQDLDGFGQHGIRHLAAPRAYPGGEDDAMRPADLADLVDGTTIAFDVGTGKLSTITTLQRFLPATSAQTDDEAWCLLAEQSIVNAVPEIWLVSAQLNATSDGAGEFELAMFSDDVLVPYYQSRLSLSAAGYVHLAISGPQDRWGEATRTIGLYMRAVGANMQIRPGSTSGYENAWMTIVRIPTT